MQFKNILVLEKIHARAACVIKSYFFFSLKKAYTSKCFRFAKTKPNIILGSFEYKNPVNE